MRYSSSILLAVAALVPAILATELKVPKDDVPSACTQQCSQIVQLGETCYKNGERGATECVCSNKTFDTSAAALSCQQCLSQQNVSPMNKAREHINKVVTICNFKPQTLHPTPQPPRQSLPPFPPAVTSAFASTCSPVTVYVTMHDCNKTSLPPHQSSSHRPTPTFVVPKPPAVTPRPSAPPARPSTTRPAANATRPGGPLPTAGASSLVNGAPLAALAAFVFLLV